MIKSYGNNKSSDIDHSVETRLWDIFLQSARIPLAGNLIRGSGLSDLRGEKLTVKRVAIPDPSTVV